MILSNVILYSFPFWLQYFISPYFQSKSSNFNPKFPPSVAPAASTRQHAVAHDFPPRQNRKFRRRISIYYA